MGHCAAFPDLTTATEDEGADRDKLMHGTTGTCNKKASWQEMHIARFDGGGKLVEHWATMDQAGMLAQLGFMPQPGH